MQRRATREQEWVGGHALPAEAVLHAVVLEAPPAHKDTKQKEDTEAEVVPLFACADELIKEVGTNLQTAEDIAKKHKQTIPEKFRVQFGALKQQAHEALLVFKREALRLPDMSERDALAKKIRKGIKDKEERKHVIGDFVAVDPENAWRFFGENTSFSVRRGYGIFDKFI